MALDEATAKDIARLARLRITNSEQGVADDQEVKALDTLVAEFSKIVGYMDILAQADTTGVEPLYSPMVEPLPPREDQPRTTENNSDSLLQNAPERIGRYFSVPRVF
ncbi:MAG: Asp-tRNA(Asn)/Glu-tRNA(Gln) amidotransferase subunit GatC [Deltaproteobacteria bacterium]|jgi:aspartyl-tRNA(Asn)/glutamyl-tRNA(Gln) amidotransferase subunit C|nr:Asp-tRNA(Asn)/Glu-tRNA(Gln) amidotransferase subunit GatC [Deltaproteobacteria bacterium]